MCFELVTTGMCAAFLSAAALTRSTCVQVVVGFARQTRQGLSSSPASHCCCGAPGTAWQLKALTCLLSLAEADMHPSFSSRIARSAILLCSLLLVTVVTEISRHVPLCHLERP